MNPLCRAATKDLCFFSGRLGRGFPRISSAAILVLLFAAPLLSGLGARAQALAFDDGLGAPESTRHEVLSPCAQRVEDLLARGYAPDTVVATLPDPVDSHFAREFDLFLAAIRRAMEQSGYVQDRHCLAWPTPGSKLTPEELEARRHLPGLVIYRHDGSVSDGDSPRFLALALAGEMPTWGVRQEAFEAALDLAWWLNVRPPRKPPPLKILGPTFSGSARSLSIALRGWLDGRFSAGIDVILVSGTATDPSLRPVIRRLLGCPDDDAFLGSTCGRHRARIEVVSAATPADQLQSKLLDDFVPTILGRLPPHAVAFLQESSEYGTSFDEERSTYHVLPFPMHISHLRTEYDKGRPDEASETPLPGGLESGPAERQTLGLELGDLRQTRDSLPLYDPSRSPSSQDLVLANILETIARYRIELVLIIATNALDKVFLAEKIQQYAPDVRLATFEGDLLLAHPRALKATRGMLVASSYPLTFPGPHERRAEEGGQSFHFASDNAQGIFEATRCLAGGGCDKALEREVWISAVGNGNLVPLKSFQAEAAPEAQRRLAALGELLARPGQLSATPRTARPEAIPPRGWTLLFTLVSAGLALLLVHSGWHYRRGRPLLAGLIAAARPEPERTPLWRAFIALLPLSVALPYCLLSGPYLYRADDVFSLGKPTSLLAVALLAVLVLASVFSLVGLWRHSRADPRLESATGRELRRARLVVFAPAVITTAAAFSLFVLMLWIVYQYQRASEGGDIVLLLDRSILIGTGLSPLLPSLLMFSVLILWLFMGLDRCEKFELLPDPEEAEGLGSTLTLLRKSLRPAAFPAFWTYAPLALVLLVIPFLYLAYYYPSPGSILPRPVILKSVELHRFDIVLSLLFAGVVVLAVNAGASLLVAWRVFNRLMSRLALLRFEGEPASRAVGGVGGEEGEGKAPSRWLDRVREASELTETTRAHLDERRQAAFDALFEIRASVPAGELASDLEVVDGSPGPRWRNSARAWLALARWLERRAETGDTLEAPFLDRARDFFAFHTALLCRAVKQQLGQLMAFMTAALLLSLLMLISYPFEPGRVLLFYLESLVILGMGVSLYVIFRMERQPVLSLLAGTEPEKVAWRRALFGRLAVYAAVPILSLLAGSFPELRQALMGLVEPIFKIFL